MMRIHFWSTPSFRLATAGMLGSIAGWTVAASAADTTGSASSSTLEEVVVTAQKRSERLQDVPVPVTSISSDTLLERNQVQFADYLREVPSVSLNSTGDGQNVLVIRGVATSALSNPTVGVTIDDIPYGSSSAYGYGSVLTPDLDPADLSHVEVLRGPQGTLYGASSLGGLLKFVTSDPSLTEITGRAQVDFNSVQHGSEGYGVRGAISIPLIANQLGVSVSGFKRQDPGFIDDPVRGLKDINQLNVRGGRLSALWKPVDFLSVKVSVMAQDSHSNGVNAVDSNSSLQPTYGDLTQSRAPGSGIYENKFRLYSAIINAALGEYTLSSLSGYSVNDYNSSLEYNSALFSELAQQYFGVTRNTLLNAYRTKKFSQELRITSPSGRRIEWVAGAFYTHEKTPVTQSLVASDVATGAAAGSLIEFAFPTTYEEFAAFGDVTVHFTDRFDVQFGGRESENRQTYSESDFGVTASSLFGSDPFVFPEQRTKANAFTYLLTPRLKLAPDLMLYARLASGYRAGGNNGEAPAFGLPLTFSPDKTQNYEIGLKGALFGNLLTYDASLYYIDWKDIQLQQSDPASGIVFFTNGGKARSAGAELSVQARPSRGLTLGLSTAYDDAELRQPLPLTAGFGRAGDRLPYSARFTVNLSADQEFVLTADWKAFLGATIAYTGNRLGEFVNPVSTDPLVPALRSELPAFTKLDLRTGANFRNWRFSFIVDNVGDKRGIMSAQSRISGSAQATDPYTFTVIRPRTYGLSVSTNF